MNEEIRREKVDEMRAKLEAGTLLIGFKLDVALDRLIDAVEEDIERDERRIRKVA